MARSKRTGTSRKGLRRSSKRSGLEERIKTALRQAGPARPKELAKRLRVSGTRYPEFRTLLKTLASDGVLVHAKGGRLALAGHGGRSTGLLTVTRGGHGFVQVEGERDDVFVPGDQLGTALPGDRVAIQIVDRPPGRNPVGEVLQVVEAGRATLVGTYEHVREFGFVVPFDPRLRRDLLIPQGEEGGATQGDLVVARITQRGNRKHGPLGQVDQVLGPSSDPKVRSLAIARGKGFDPAFPPDVGPAVEGAFTRPLGARVDRTADLVFTIDPADAKDHDDAVGVTALDGGGWEVAVHIADVSHYVDPGGPVDREAESRGTSVYLVDQVIPMLPEELSTDLCSLVPGKPRPVVSVFLHIDAEGRTRSARFERGLVQSRRKLSYEDAEAILTRMDSAGPDIDEAVRQAGNVARTLKTRRLERGSLDLDFPEAKIELDESGRPVSSRAREHLESHGLIEELMLAANEAVARACIERELPIPFRIHESPSGESLEEALGVLRSLGFSVADDPGPEDLQAVVLEARGTERETLVNWLVLKALKRAVYSGVNEGHFGLAAEAYAHFTSPIRRYPDLMVHRAVLAGLIDEPAEGGRGTSLQGMPADDELEALCTNLSRREREAEEAERDSILLSQIELMIAHVGETFSGRIVGITQFGVFVRLPDPFVEGLLHVSQIGNDYLDFDPAKMELVGRRTGLRFVLGQELEVLVARVNREERRIDFSLPDAGKPTRPRHRRRRRA